MTLSHLFSVCLHMGALLKIGKKGNYSAVEAHFAENIPTELKAYEKQQAALTITQT